ncbi:hypothetical protein SD81_023255 [Tolypothrix campylonemoides VB511288]|nr:hypothetical protein SD81_023255 [Tolypothrix campylonemoides VB511288]
MRLALVTAIAFHDADDDLPLLREACAAAGIATETRAWDDASVQWSRFDAALLRSPWDYTWRLPAFLRWCERASHATRLWNPLPVVRWNTDKHYLRDLAAAGIPAVPTAFVEPDVEPLPALEAFLATLDAPEFVLKPAVSAGSRDTHRIARSDVFAAANTLGALLQADRSAMLQPYLDTIDAHGETGLVFLGGAFSHAIRKAALLAPDGTAHAHDTLPEAISTRAPAADKLALAQRVLDAAMRRLALPAPPVYARVDLIRAADATPMLLELELVEPSLFLSTAPGAAERLAGVLVARFAER